MSDQMSNDPTFPEADLARLADGSLAPERQDELRAQVQASPALSRALAEQERAVGVLRSTQQVTAPDSLRARLEELSAPAGAKAVRQARRRPRFRLGFRIPVLAGAVAAAALVAVLLIGNTGSAPTLHQTARVALAASTLPPPSENGSDPEALDVKVGGVPFPYWGRIGWPAVGRRTDTVRGRRIVTVFYRGRNGRQIGYAIVSGSPVAVPGGRTLTRSGERYTLFNVGRARAITWRRGGHTCVIAGHGVNDRILVRLATADPGRSVASWSAPAGAERTDSI